MAPFPLLSLCAAALAGHDTTLEIDNRFDGEAEVWVDGRYEGLVPGDVRARFDVRPGRRTVEVRRPNSGYVLASTRLHFPNGGLVMLPIEAPDARLRVQNAGEVALRLQLDDETVWIQPGTTLTLPVEAGHLHASASIKEPRGDFTTFERTLWLEPGELRTEVLRPDPTVLTLVNHDHHTVRVHLDGEDAGLLAPGATRVVYVRPGSTRVTFLDLTGRSRLVRVLDLPRGERARVVLDTWLRPVPVAVAHTHRPGGPLR